MIQLLAPPMLNARTAVPALTELDVAYRLVCHLDGVGWPDMAWADEGTLVDNRHDEIGFVTGSLPGSRLGRT